MLRSLWKPNLLSVFGASTKSVGLRHCWVNRTSLYEPPYLALLKPKFPTYPRLNFQIRGYDFPVVESYQSFLHNMAESMSMDVDEAWATPSQLLQVTRLKPLSSITEAQYKLNVFERNIQISHLPAKFYPVLLRVAQAALPEGVTLNVMEHQPEHEEIRYAPDLDLIELKEQLEDMGGARKKKKK